MMSWPFPISGSCFWELWPLTSLCLGLCINVCVCIVACMCVYMYVHACTSACMFSHVWFFATPWTVACQTLLSMGFSRQAYWSGLPFPPPGELPDLRLESVSCIAGRFLTTWAMYVYGYVQIYVLCMLVYISVFVHICMHLYFLYICMRKCVCVFPVGLE